MVNLLEISCPCTDDLNTLGVSQKLYRSQICSRAASTDKTLMYFITGIRKQFSELRDSYARLSCMFSVFSFLSMLIAYSIMLLY